MVTTLPKLNLEYVLSEDELQRASVLFDLDQATLTTLNYRGLLNTPYIKDAIALDEYFRLTKGLSYISETAKLYTIPEVKQAIANKFHITATHLNSVLRTKTKANFFACKECGLVIKETLYRRTGGLCESCNSDKIISQSKMINNNVQSSDYA